MSERLDKMNQEASEVVDALDVVAYASEVKSIQSIDPMDDLRNELVGFFKNRISSIARAERIKELTYQQLEMDIEGGELNFEQKMAILMRLSRDSNDASDSLLRAIAGGNGGNQGGGGSSLFTDIVRPGSEKTDLMKAFEEYSPEELRKIHEVSKILQDIVENGEQVKEAK